MMHFLPYSAEVGGALAQSYSIILVTVSYLIAALASYAGLMMSVCIGSAESAAARRVWLAAGSVAMAIGIWAMHFTGMLALTLPCGVTYDVPVSIASVVPAILASAMALGVLSRRGNRHQRYLIGGALVGVGIGTMHYVGMAAMNLDAVKEYDPIMFGVSLIVAVFLGVSAFYVHDFRRHIPYSREKNIHIIISALLMGLAITGMHYTAMAAVFFLPDGAPAPAVVGDDTFWLSIGVTAVAVTVAVLAIIATIVGRLFQTTAHRTRVDRERIFEAIESITDGFTLYDDKGILTMCNHVLQDMYPALKTLFKPGTKYEDLVTAWAGSRIELPDGVSADAYVADSLHSFQVGAYVGEPMEERLGDGRWVYIRRHSIKHGGLATVFTDVTPIKKMQAIYEQLAAQDTLTGLVSRRFFEDRLEHAISLVKRLGHTLSVLYIDLDDFKPINDSFGHDAGDAVLKEAALRLRKAARDSDTVARLGGDEFAILMESDSNCAGATALAARIIKSISLPIPVDGHECHVRASIGIAIMPPQTVNKKALMKAADEAMYQAKAAGGSTYRIHDRLVAELLP
jgi:diguanylate cyclase (GGDEF)-like protein